jgi:hypothetical protein
VGIWKGLGSKAADEDAGMIELERAEAIERVKQLPFVGLTDGGEVEWWSAAPSGHDATDVGLGESYARLAIDVARTFELPLLIAFILRDITKSGRFSGVEAGFIAVIASAARAGSMN